ncbi:MAG: translation initiation factor IF-2 subunit beta [Candidatus Woesearchaeota archaeon]|jgi:translation initiation factor 2 subunit 2|nr:translation initiation factor IF-2 subunit beta [Candidatus Woesearchaeota archaeon]|tara:strand:+ start:42 stop:437 length:396 start_codon:yes stop_codon:yes gene_type:complete
MTYEDLLKKAREDLPEKAVSAERFEVPKVKGHIQGNKTIISNFYQIASVIGREPEHILKIISKELATPGELKKKALIIGTKTSASRINEKINNYVNKYVLCKECGKPDTKLTKDGDITFLKCMVCGAKQPA